MRFLALVLAALSLNGGSAVGNEVDRMLTQENQAHQIARPPMPVVDDLTFLRRIYVDLVGRIPTEAEILEFQATPSAERRETVVDKLFADERFVDRWTVFYQDMLRLRTNSPGGAALISFVHQSLSENMPYDEMCRRLISTNGKANKIPEVGFILGDDADPMAMASVTSQVFMGIRIGCAQCHDHPFDVWKRDDFYGMAAFFGRTRRIESQLTKVIYTMEAEQTTVLWPPEGVGEAKDRKPLAPRFPFAMEEDNGTLKFIARLAAAREARKPKNVGKTGPSVDDLLADADTKVKSRTGGGAGEAGSEAKRDIRKIDIQASLNSPSELRAKLAEMVTSPRNRYFSRAIVNRMWKELVGRGIVEPVDDFRKDNPPSHPATLDFLADEFVASGYEIRSTIRAIVLSDAYQRAHAPRDSDEATRIELETAFLATPMRRMIGEAMYDSIVTAGHLFDVKHPAGENEVVVVEKIRVPKNAKPGDKPKTAAALLAQGNGGGKAMLAGGAMSALKSNGGGYALEDAIELDFTKVLIEDDDQVAIDKMAVMSNEQLEAERMLREKMPGGMDYEEKTIKRVYDANPKFNTSLRMESPAPPGHFLRVFGQTNRQDLGEYRDETPSMRQALMMLNGRLTHEASRVGKLETLYPMLTGPKANVPQAIQLAYREIMTRQPSAQELAEAKQILSEAPSPLDGMADLRWLLLNCNEFRFLP